MCVRYIIVSIYLITSYISTLHIRFQLLHFSLKTLHVPCLIFLGAVRFHVGHSVLGVGVCESRSGEVWQKQQWGSKLSNPRLAKDHRNNVGNLEWTSWHVVFIECISMLQTLQCCSTCYCGLFAFFLLNLSLKLFKQIDIFFRLNGAEHLNKTAAPKIMKINYDKNIFLREQKDRQRFLLWCCRKPSEPPSTNLFIPPVIPPCA